MHPRRLIGEHVAARPGRIGPGRLDHRASFALHDRLGVPLELLEIPGRDDPGALQPRRVGEQRIPGGPELVPLAVRVAVLGEPRVLPRRPRIAAEIQHVVVVGVTAHAHRHGLDQRRTQPAARPFDGPGKCRGNRIGIGAVGGDARDPVADRLVGKHPGGSLLGDGRRQRGLIVLDTKDGRQAPHRAEVDRFVPFAQRGSAFADERQHDAPGAIARERHGEAGGGQRGGRERRGRRQDAPLEITDVQILAVERRAGLAHLGVQHHAHRRRLRPHGERHPEIADDRSDDVADPTVGAAIGRAAAQADGCRVDGFLSQRTEAFALKRRVAVADLAAREKRFQAVVGGARQHHAAQNLAALVRCQRRFDRRSAEEAVARVQEFRERLLEADVSGRARRGVRQIRRHAVRPQPLGELAPQRGTKRVDGGLALQGRARRRSPRTQRRRHQARTDSARRRRLRSGSPGRRHHSELRASSFELRATGSTRASGLKLKADEARLRAWQARRPTALELSSKLEARS